MAYTIPVSELAATWHPVMWRRPFKPKPPAPTEPTSSHVLDAHLASLRIATTTLENVAGLITAHLQVTGIMVQDDHANG